MPNSRLSAVCPKLFWSLIGSSVLQGHAYFFGFVNLYLPLPCPMIGSISPASFSLFMRLPAAVIEMFTMSIISLRPNTPSKLMWANSFFAFSLVFLFAFKLSIDTYFYKAVTSKRFSEAINTFSPSTATFSGSINTFSIGTL